MKKVLIVANWKENLTAPQAKEWLGVLSSKFKVQSSKLEVVICPPSVILPTVAHEVSKLENVELGAQNVSKFEEGQYTGEVSAKMLKDFVSYVIVGHSERRKYFGETDEDVNLKIKQCLKYGLTPIVCVGNLEQVSRVSRVSKVIVVYEPVEAISTEGQFHPDDPEHANSTAKEIKSVVGQDVKVLYGGSVNAKNAKSFVSQPNIDGVLVGQASLGTKEFSKIVEVVHLHVMYHRND